MLKPKISLLILFALSGVLCCSEGKVVSVAANGTDSVAILKPFLVTDSVKYDTDDPAIWIHPTDRSQSLILGTDKGGDSGDGSIYVFDLKGKEVKSKTVHNIKRPNNIDVAYGLKWGKDNVDIAVCTERNTNSLRVFSLPDMKVIDNGGIPVFENDTSRLPMGVALYTVAGDVYAIVSRKSGPSGAYLHQYRLTSDGVKVTAKFVRAFGNYSGRHEIEAVAVDNEAGYVYYSDEGAGVRKYYAHPDSTKEELAIFATSGFTDNHEGISIYKTDSLMGYIIVSDQQANQFQLFSREGDATNPHEHKLIGVLKASTIESDGNDVTSISLPQFPNGLFVAMSDDRTFQIYQWPEVIRFLKRPGLK